jgi:double-stranded uracil-DNA glycosylase
LEGNAVVEGLDWVVGREPRVLILGSMPGSRSLAEGRYYVGRGNRFWDLMGELLSFDATADYEARIESLMTSGVALWDVLETCDRDGSLDSRIVQSTERPNDLRQFFRSHPGVRLVALNGKKAAASFRHWFGDVGTDPALPPALELPSTSGANTRFTRAALVTEWRQLGNHLL